jgi:uncharacterized membrane protein required for colicin V production
MIAGIAWPDIVIAAILLLAVAKGWTRGFVQELGGAVAVACALITPWFYNGSMDDSIQNVVHLGPGSAHVIGMFLTGLATYVIVLAASWVLSGIAKLPILGTGNALGGAIVGFVKGSILIWVVLYFALFFPLSRDIRDDLHRSQLAPHFTLYFDDIDKAVLATLPWFARPFMLPYFSRHHV